MYTLIFLGVAVLVLLALGGFFYFLSWMDRKIDSKDRLGSSSIVKKKKTEEER
ncbi:MAG: hypothetical protein V1720_08390 [bacterium]